MPKFETPLPVLAHGWLVSMDGDAINMRHVQRLSPHNVGNTTHAIMAFMNDEMLRLRGDYLTNAEACAAIAEIVVRA